MIKIIELPQVGESVTEGVIGKWLVEPGQHVEKYDPLVEVVTDKVSMEAPSPYTGVFVRALANEGETVPMGQPICEMEIEGEEPPVVPAEAGTSQPSPVIPAEAGIQETAGDDDAVEESEEAPVEDEAAEEDAGRVGGAWAMPAASADEPQESEQAEEAAQPAFEFMDSVRSVGPTGSGERGEGRLDALQDEALAEQEHEGAAPSTAEPDRHHVISPLVARLSAQYGIDLSTLQGTGTGGRITSKDLLEAVSRLSAPAQEERAEEEAAPEVSAPISLEGEGQGEGEQAEAAPEEETETAAEVAIEESEEPAEAVVSAETEEEAEEGVAVVASEEDEEEEEVAEQEPAEIAAVAPEEAAEDIAEEEPAEEAFAGAAPAEPVAAVAPEEVTEEIAEEEPTEGAFAEAAPVEPVATVAPEEAAEEIAEEEPAEEVLAEAAPAAPVATVATDAEAEEEVAPEDEPVEAAPAEAVVEEETSVMPLTPVRRIIAEHMARSSREIPAAWAMVEVDVTRLVRARDALKAAFEQTHGISLTYLPFAASAAAAALREHPRLNARWDGGHITLNNRVNLAVAVSTEAGLMVPVVRDADTLSIVDIAAELRRLTDAARQGRLSIEDVQGGTFTLNNTGALGSVVSVPIINYPQAAILTTEAIVKRPVVIEGDAIAVRSMMNLCLTFDHRICDGAAAAAFLGAVKARLQAVDESIGLG